MWFRHHLADIEDRLGAFGLSVDLGNQAGDIVATLQRAATELVGPLQSIAVASIGGVLNRGYRIIEFIVGVLFVIFGLSCLALAGQSLMSATLDSATLSTFLGGAPDIYRGRLRLGQDGDFVSLPAGSKQTSVGRRF